MIEWEVAGDGADGLPPTEQESPSSRRGAYRWLITLSLALAVAAGLFWWRLERQEQWLRDSIQQVVDAETRLMADMGKHEEPALFLQQLAALADPAAPVGWTYRYQGYMSRQHELSSLPEVVSVRLFDDGTLALIEVGWPLAEAAEPETPERTERRAYRLIEGTWRRAPYPLERGEPVELQSEHFILRAARADATLLAADSPWSIDFEALRARIHATWPASWLARQPLFLTVTPREFESQWEASFGANQQTILLNSPRIAPFDYNSPLGAAAQYRLDLTRITLSRLIAWSQFEAASQEFESVGNYFIIQMALRDAEARWWALDETELQLLREQTRDATGPDWYSPFDGPLSLLSGASDDERYALPFRSAGISLLLDLMVEREGPDVIGEMARVLATTHPGAFDLAALCASVTDLSEEELEAELYRFARTAGQ